MHKSKSTISFGPTNEHTELIRQPRSRRRSSLDTFLIPGRTRLPSSKTSISSQDATDMQIAHNLFNHSVMPRSQAPSRSGQGRRESTSDKTPTPKSGNGRHAIAPQSTAFVPRISQRIQPPSRPVQEVIIIPRQRRVEANGFQESPHLRATDPDINPVEGRLDGPSDTDDSGHGSRFTSQTWSTVSHRIFSDSSGNSQASRFSEFRLDYNIQAEKYGLPLLEGETNEEDSKNSQTKITQKSHHGWLSRKIFRRSSSTYTLKAKTTYKALSQKKSLSNILLLADARPTNILTGKSLDEICRLGGLGVLILPADYAAGKITLPTCLSASAAYLLEHGCNAPGLFRISGTSSIINALFDFFDHQFSDSGSPSKVEETVGADTLPSEPDYTLHDIASLFKKIIIGLPGGLLGSLEIFEALRNILLHLHVEQDVAGSSLSQLQAKLIALAISSIASLHRAQLIQAVLGLVSYFGFEADQAQEAERLAATTGDPNGQPRSEIMSYQSLGKVLGPLLLGDLTDSVNVSDSNTELRKAAELHQGDTKKSKKQKGTPIPNKLEQDATLSAHVDRANLTANVMYLVLLNWKEVVKQLRELKDVNNSNLQLSRSKDQSEMVPSRIASRLALNTSEENTQFMDVLRGRQVPQDFRGEVKMKRRVKITSRSPMGRGATQVSDHGNAGQDWLLDSSGRQVIQGRTASNANEPNDLPNTGSPRASNVESPSLRVCPSDKVPGSSQEGRTKSDLMMDEMAMGTILTPLKDSSASLEQKPLSEPASPRDTPSNHSRTSSSSYVPETAFRRVPTPSQRQASIRVVKNTMTDKPLPVIGDAQRAEYTSMPEDIDFDSQLHERILSSRRSRNSQASTETSPNATRRPTPRTLFPSRGSSEKTPSSLPRSRKEFMLPFRQSQDSQEQSFLSRSIDPLRTFQSMADYKAWSKSESASPPDGSDFGNESRAPPALEKTTDYSKQDGTGSVKFLAQKFTEASRATRNDELARQAVQAGEAPKVYAYVEPLHKLSFSFDDPFISSLDDNVESNGSPGRSTLIPKPVQDVGRGRKAEYGGSPKGTPSPPKRAAPPTPRYGHKSSSVFHRLRDKDAEIVRANAKADKKIHNEAPTAISRNLSSEPTLQKSSDHIRPSTHYPSQDSEAPYPRSDQSTCDVEVSSEKPKLESRDQGRVLSIGRPVSPDEAQDPSPAIGYLTQSSPSRVNSYPNASNALTKLERHSSINPTLFQEVRRLNRLLDQRNEEVLAAQRSLEAARETRDNSPARGSQRGSWCRSSWNEEEAKKELSLWKKKAEDAESKLASMKRLMRAAAKEQVIDVDALIERDRAAIGTKNTKRAGLSVEILVGRAGDVQHRPVELCEDEGWEARALEEDWFLEHA